MKIKRKIITIDEERCDGCGSCVSACSEGALAIADGKARVVSDRFCDGLGACIGECPQDALHIIEREADEFDERAVREHVNAPEKQHPDAAGTMPCGCPSSQIMVLERDNAQPRDDRGLPRETELTHWPIQLRLVPPDAVFLQGADLLIASDCAAAACPDFHRRFIAGRVLLMGCPKFDDLDSYREKCEHIFRTAGIRSIMVVIMEVPCCSGMPAMVRHALSAAPAPVSCEVVTLNLHGAVIDRRSAA